MKDKRKCYVVGRTKGGMRRRWFATEQEASRYIEMTVRKNDPKGVENGDYYIDPPEDS